MAGAQCPLDPGRRARNVLMEGLQLAGRDDRDLRVDARGASLEEFCGGVLAYGDEVQFTRSGQCNRAGDIV
jgi:hypothetical protein